MVFLLSVILGQTPFDVSKPPTKSVHTWNTAGNEVVVWWQVELPGFSFADVSEGLAKSML